MHLAPTAGVGLGGHLDGISAYPEGPTWHLVTYGLTELWAKESPDPEWSGWGYEFTLRVPDLDGSPPSWAYKLLHAVAGVTQQGTVFGPGHRLAAGGPLTGSEDTLLSAVAFTLDPDLATITTPNGRVDFLMLVGVTPKEVEEMKASSTLDVLDRLRQENPRLVTDPRRAT